MGWHDVVEAGELSVRPSPYETDRFGVSVDRVTVPAAADVSIGAVAEAVAASRADVVVLRYPARQVTWFADLAAGPRTALLADSLVYWSLRVGRGRRPAPTPGLSAEVETGVDDAVVDAVVADIFDGYGNHYRANPLFDVDLVLAGYQEWARRTVETTGAVILRDADRRTIGLGTVVHSNDVTEIELAGIVAAEQGRGRYGQLLAAMEDAAARVGSTRLVISTQGHNTGVQRAWARYGLEPVHALVTVHLIRPELLAARRSHPVAADESTR